MASRKNLSENEIQNLLLDVRDEDEVFLGDELEDELDEIIPDFRDEQVPVEEFGSNHETDLESSEEEVEEDIVQVRITNSPVIVLTVPEVLREILDKNTGINYFRSTMSEKRFEFLTNCLRFDDRSTRAERRQHSKLAPIKELFDHIVETSKSLYSPSDCTTIDEQLLGFRGRCPFRMYIPSKPDKYGIKLLMFCDAKSYYMINSITYTGKDSTPRELPVAEYYALELSTSIHGSNRNITHDNLFTSIPAAEKLLTKNVTTVGTMKRNKTEIPTHFLETKNRLKNTSMFAVHDELTLLSYVPPKLSKGKKKNVIMLSTMHYQPDEDKSVDLPEIISFHNQTKGGVDTFYQLCHTYSISRKTCRWSLCVFYGILNIVGINSMILLHSSKANGSSQPPGAKYSGA
ncbi:unnamed protein product [Parnassius apollo]|uniref:(apollo) hypothetical protein n=1 Tax=Parnassius apollo TaxID=110799 RepID=A0A8S3WVT7_PARAO|nr:unnamed protein product [Parnassius apollo]